MFLVVHILVGKMTPQKTTRFVEKPKAHFQVAAKLVTPSWKAGSWKALFWRDIGPRNSGSEFGGRWHDWYVTNLGRFLMVFRLLGFVLKTGFKWEMIFYLLKLYQPYAPNEPYTFIIYNSLSTKWCVFKNKLTSDCARFFWFLSPTASTDFVHDLDLETVPDLSLDACDDAMLDVNLCHAMMPCAAIQRSVFIVQQQLCSRGKPSWNTFLANGKTLNFLGLHI